MPALRASKNRRYDRIERNRAGMGSNDTHCTVHELSPGTAGKSKNRRLPPAVHARRKEERKNEKIES